MCVVVGVAVLVGGEEGGAEGGDLGGCAGEDVGVPGGHGVRREVEVSILVGLTIVWFVFVVSFRLCGRRKVRRSSYFWFVVALVV